MSAIRQMKIDHSLPYSQLNFIDIFLSPILISSLAHRATRENYRMDEVEKNFSLKKIVEFQILLQKTSFKYLFIKVYILIIIG